MTKFFKKHEPLLHSAVLEDRYEDLKRLILDQTLLSSINSLGFTALELAHFLGKEESIEILQPESPRLIKALSDGAHIRSKYTPIEFEQVFGIRYLSHIRFDSYPLLKEVIKNAPLVLKYTFLGEENRELGIRYREEIRKGHVADTTIVWIDSEVGYGLFANENIEIGDFVGEYTGEIRRLYRLEQDHNAYCFHYPTRFFSWKYFIIDALYEGNEMRYINHSDNPNLQQICLFDRGLLHLCFLARIPIHKGTQLTLNYGEDYWKYNRKNIIRRQF